MYKVYYVFCNKNKTIFFHKKIYFSQFSRHCFLQNIQHNKRVHLWHKKAVSWAESVGDQLKLERAVQHTTPSHAKHTHIVKYHHYSQVRNSYSNHIVKKIQVCRFCDRFVQNKSYYQIYSLIRIWFYIVQTIVIN